MKLQAKNMTLLWKTMKIGWIKKESKMKKIWDFMIKYDELMGNISFVVVFLVIFWCVLVGF